MLNKKKSMRWMIITLVTRWALKEYWQKIFKMTSKIYLSRHTGTASAKHLQQTWCRTCLKVYATQLSALWSTLRHWLGFNASNQQPCAPCRSCQGGARQHTLLRVSVLRVHIFGYVYNERKEKKMKSRLSRHFTKLRLGTMKKKTPNN